MNRALLILAATTLYAQQQRLPVRVTWGHGARAAASYSVKIVGSEGLTVSEPAGFQLEASERLENGVWHTRAGGGDVDGAQFELSFANGGKSRIQNVHTLWADLIAAADPDSARRLGNDAAMEPDSPRLYIQTADDGTRGFALTVAQLQRERALWIPAFDVYVAAGELLIDYAQHAEARKAWKGRRILDRIRREPEASYEEFARRWEDMGSPAYMHPRAAGPGHIICLAWDGSLYKFGVDRGAGVRNDLGNADRFKLWFDFGDITQGIAKAWRSQNLQDGLPIVTTVFEREGVRYEVEQFVHPAGLFERLRASSLDAKARMARVTLSHQRAIEAFDLRQSGQSMTAIDRGSGNVVLEVDNAPREAAWFGVRDYGKAPLARLDITMPLDVPATGFRDVVVKLPSPAVPRMEPLDYATAREAVARHWSGWLDKGAMFRVPEKVVNDLFRANIWHALRLPRRHPDGAVDLPYSNFAYGQKGAPWPINQAVYVDYMLYGLRGYFDVAADEIEAQYSSNQKPDGRITGYANWLSYTPAMLYAVARTYLLSGDRAALDRVMPPSLKALDWCMEQSRTGLVTGPLNDLRGDGVWARNQAYMYAGLEMFGRVLEEIGNAGGREARATAARLALAAEREFRTASAKSPLVQMRDHTWSPFVPSSAQVFRRNIDDWYPTDVDSGPVHMLRLKLIPAASDLGDWLLNDHEDNLYYKGWGMSNEPVYMQQATAYILRDDPAAVIRAFYSNMASAFSHSTLEPVEHRWTHGQFFGPPSTDGSWFETYRNMLIHERDDGTLLVCGFTPRRWLEDGKRIEVRRAPTMFGAMSMVIESKAGRITADIETPVRKKPAALLIRLRHPLGNRLRAVLVNGKQWKDFDPAREWVRITEPDAKRYLVEASY